MPSAIGSNQGFAPQQTQIALSSSFSDIQLLSNFDAMELQGYVFIDAASDYRASFKLSIIKNGAGVYEIAASDIAGDDYLGSPIMSFQISGNYLQCKMDVASPTSGYVKFNIDTPTPALVGTSSLSIEGSNIVSEIPASRLPKSTLADATEQYLVPEYREATIDISTLSAAIKGDFATGTLKIVRVGNVVTISAYTNLGHSSLSDVYSGDGFLPDWARPSNYERTNAYSVSGQIATVVIYPTGKMRTFYISANTGTYSPRTTTLPLGITFVI